MQNRLLFTSMADNHTPAQPAWTWADNILDHPRALEPATEQDLQEFADSYLAMLDTMRVSLRNFLALLGHHLTALQQEAILAHSLGESYDMQVRRWRFYRDISAELSEIYTGLDIHNRAPM
jgi:hypothetical protein